MAPQDETHPPAPVPPRPTLPRLREAAESCRACDLYKTGTHVVFGEGPAPASLMLVGEQPGNHEDRAGRPFVGPAGKLLDKALAEIGLSRSDVYVTNVVKHFKWVPAEGSKRRLHKKPNAREQAACTPWLAAELAVVRPAVIVCLGATAAQALLGKSFRVSKQRGELVKTPLARHGGIATLHPSAILRAPDREARDEMFALLVADLAKAVREARSLEVPPEARP